MLSELKAQFKSCSEGRLQQPRHKNRSVWTPLSVGERSQNAAGGTCLSETRARNVKLRRGQERSSDSWTYAEDNHSERNGNTRRCAVLLSAGSAEGHQFYFDSETQRPRGLSDLLQVSASRDKRGDELRITLVGKDLISTRTTAVGKYLNPPSRRPSTAKRPVPRSPAC